MNTYRINKQEESSSSLNSNGTVSIPSSYFQTDPVSSVPSETSVIVDDHSKSSSMEISSFSKVENNKQDVREPSCSKKVNISVQADRSIIGEEDTLQKERKRWIRPPVLGQASSNDDRNAILQVTNSLSSESEDEIKAQISSRKGTAGFISDVYQNRRDYINEKPMEGGSDQSLPPFSDLQDFQRIPTPSSVSSITPRPLEWDSGADVGYFQHYGSTHTVEPEFSAIEGMPLDKGQAGILLRSDPEGTTSSIKGNSTVVNMIGIPKSESTPIIDSQSGSKNGIKNLGNSRKISSKGRHPHLFPEVIIEKKGNQSDSSSDGNYVLMNNKSVESSGIPAKNVSSSFENLANSKIFENQAATFPRSLNQQNVVDENMDILRVTSEKTSNPPQSVSSSSIATVVTGLPEKVTKCVQTSSTKNSIGTQSSLVDHRERRRHVYKKGDNNDSSTLESIQMSAGDRVNSFEYLPGHVYENTQNPESSDIWENTGGVSLRSDVERGVHILEEFIQGSNANNTLMKKELIQRVVKRLIHTDYPEDSESTNNLPQRCTTRRSQNRDEVIGESSSENAVLNKQRSDNSTSVSGHTSSTWQSISESTKTSDQSNTKSFEGVQVEVPIDEKKSKPKLEGVSVSKTDWKAPVTRTEKLYEYKKKGVPKKMQGKDDQLLDFINSERENQLDWIVKEINHLSNLKTLLEKHERLRKSLNRLKKAKMKNENILENEIELKTRTRSHGFRRRPILSCETSKRPTIITDSKTSNKTDDSDNSWDSHNYGAGENGKLTKTVSTETRKEDISGGIKSTAYTITFEPSKEVKNGPERKEKNHNPVIVDRQTLAKMSRELVRETYSLPSLQDHLLAKRPDIINRAEMRRKTVAELAAVRQLREENRPVVLAAALSCDTGLTIPPPPPLVKRVVSQKEMRQQTEKKYRKTFEVQKKISELKLKETLKTNRLMADVYNKRLQLLTLKGRTNLSNSLDVISTV